MISTAWFQRGFVVLFCAGMFGWCPAQAQQNPVSSTPYGVQPVARRPIQVAERSTPLPRVSQISLERRPNEHPLMPALRWANEGLKQMDQRIQDYSAIVEKRERIQGKLGEPQWIFVKIRHKPFSVYMHFLKPQSIKGREVIYVEGANNGKLSAHATGLQSAFGTLDLKPTSPLAMRGQHYPITDMGVRNLVQRLLVVGSNDVKYGECDVKIRRNAKIGPARAAQRICTLIEVTHPRPRRSFLFHKALIFVDDELNIPIRYESHDWPKEPGGQPELIESYTYLNLKINNGFTDADFDIHNPSYKFKEGRH